MKITRSFSDDNISLSWENVWVESFPIYTSRNRLEAQNSTHLFLHQSGVHGSSLLPLLNVLNLWNKGKSFQ